MTDATLQATDQWYRAFGDATPGFLWLTDPGGRILYVNRTWEQYTGSTLEEINRGGWAQFNHPSEAAAVQQKWALALEREQPFEAELRYRRHDGVYRWMLARVVPFRDADGKLLHWVGTSVDIEDLKQASADLRHREQELTDFFENAAVPIHWV
ncbi:MAG TPA: PAS domain-containing protein, partial [Gemmatimonadales bacterium]|nr:PAS domain-containing protein [Gemmatimonadales bacterium]